MKIAFLFAGQGAQYVGMGKDLYEANELVKAMYDSIHLDFDVKDVCFNGPKEVLDDTRYTQAAIFMHSMACASLLREYGIMPSAVAGLSLGEYSALCFANAFSLEDGAHIVGIRGQLMADALPQGTTSMAAVLMLDENLILEACQEVKHIGVCEIANYNCPGQIVITGDKEAVEQASKLCLEKGARKVIPLQVSGAFHSSLLEQASRRLETVLKGYQLQTPSIPVYHNVSGTPLEEDLVTILGKQICHSVYFTQTINNMLKDGIDVFVEVGPGKTISGFVKKITKGKDVKILHVEDQASLMACIQALKG